MSPKKQVYLVLVCSAGLMVLLTHMTTIEKEQVGGVQNFARGFIHQAQNFISSQSGRIGKNKRKEYGKEVHVTTIANNDVDDSNKNFQRNDRSELLSSKGKQESVDKVLDSILDGAKPSSESTRDQHGVGKEDRQQLSVLRKLSSTLKMKSKNPIGDTPGLHHAQDRVNQTKTGNKNNVKFTFPINEKKLCSKYENSDIVLLISVFCGVDEQVEREYIRTQWGSIAKTHPQIRLLFIIGLPSDQKSNSANLSNESSINHDIIQANYLDTYRNLTLKTFALVQWIHTYCREAKYILKIDSDMQIDPERLTLALKTQQVPDKFICGYFMDQRIVVREKNKWYVPEEVYTPSIYPDYCQGPAYIVSKTIIEKLARVPCPVEPFPIDDAYITGILREQLNINITTAIIKFVHHYGETEVKLSNGRYIMNVDVILNEQM